MVKMKFIFILNFLILEISSKDGLIIPFKKNLIINETMSEEEIIRQIKRNDIIIEINLGTPLQKLEYYLKSEPQFYYTFTKNTRIQIMREDEEKSLLRFCQSESTTYKFLKYTYLSDDFYDNFCLFQDTIQIGNKTIEKFPVLETLEMQILTNGIAKSGQIGFGPINYQEDDDIHFNFISNLKQYDIISTYDYFYEFDNETNGKIIIGIEPYEYNIQKYKNKLNQFARCTNSGSNIQWGFTIDTIKYKEKILDNEGIGGFNSKIKIDYGYITFGKEMNNILLNDFFKETINKGICKVFSLDNEYFYICQRGKFDKSKLGILELYSTELKQTFKIDLSKLFFDIGNFSYFLVNIHQYDNDITLGEQFLRYNDPIVFNQDSKIIKSYSEYKRIQNNKSYIYIWVIVGISFVFICIIIILLYIYLFSKSNIKRRAIELEDEFNYIPMISKN